MKKYISSHRAIYIIGKQIIILNYISFECGKSSSCINPDHRLSAMKGRKSRVWVFGLV
jgi:hypothetical protein